MSAAIQNLEFLRRLIEEARQDNTYADMARLRMIQDTGLGTDAVTNKSEDR